MATETGPDLESAREAVEALMDDEAEVWEIEDWDSWVLDPLTLQLVRPAGVTPIYSGRCKVSDATGNSRGANASDEGGQQLSYIGTRIGFPIHEAPLFKRGQIVKMLTSRRDPTLPGTVFVVSEPVQKTMAIQRLILADRRDRVEP